MRSGLVGRVVMMLATLAACGRAGYATVEGEDGGSSVPDASPPAPLSCDQLPDSTPCDDRNICTAASTCLASACVPDEPVATCIVAEASQEYTGVQGSLGWWYGMWFAEIDADQTYDPSVDFEAMAYYPDIWRPVDYDPTPGADGYTWAYLAPYWEHPGGMPLKIPVRRWVSDVSGPAIANVHHSKSDVSGGDGTRATLVVDGATLWTHEVAGTDGTGVTEDIDVELHVGSTVDWLIHPISYDSQDTTSYDITIRSR